MTRRESSTTSKATTRRHTLKVAVAILCCPMSAARATSTTRGDQVTNVNASAAHGMFRFEPDLVRLSPGDKPVFLNSRSDHTVHTVPELWPEDVPPVAVAHKPESNLSFEREGLYGFHCRRHGQYGMVMLVVVGPPTERETLREAVGTMRANPRERSAFLNLLGRYVLTGLTARQAKRLTTPMHSSL